MALKNLLRGTTVVLRLKRRLGRYVGQARIGPFGKTDDDGVLHLTHDAGFFSNCSVALFEIARAKRQINRVDASHSFSFYKEFPNEDIWPELFQAPNPHPPANYGEWSRELLHHARYSSLNLQRISSLLEAYFSPSDEVLERARYFEESYDIDFSRTLGVNFRGTDKWTEVPPAPHERWVRKIHESFRKMPQGSRILLQTDDEKALQRFLNEFSHHAFVLNELPRSLGPSPVHLNLRPTERLNFAKNLLAMALILSRCRTLVTHTGNVAYWTTLFRGHSRNLAQF